MEGQPRCARGRGLRRGSRRHGSIGKPHLPYLTTALIELQLYRFDFNYEGIYEILSRADDAPLQVGPYDLNGIYLTFAQLSSGKRVSAAALFASIGLELDAASNVARDLDRVPIKLRHLLLHGMWLFPFRYYGVEMLILAESLVKSDPKDGNAYYRMGEAYRRIAAATQWDVEPGSAVVETPELELSPAIRSAVEQQVANVDATVLELSRQLEAESNKLVWKSVEVLSLFAALMGLLITNISVLGIQGISTAERVGLIVLMAVVMVGFFLLVRNTVFRVRDDRTGQEEVPTRAQRFSLRRPSKTAAMQERIDELEHDVARLRRSNYQFAPLLSGPSEPTGE